MEVWNPEHPHHTVWREYTQSLLDGKPKVVEWYAVSGKWVTTDCPEWHQGYQYRIARPTLTLTYTVPMPVTEPLEMLSKYYVELSDGGIALSVWRGDELDYSRLVAGVCHLTQEDAQAAIDARAAAMRAALEAAK